MSYAAQMAELTLGQRIRLARMQSNLTGDEVAEAVGRRRETLSAWENDHQEPKATDIARLIDVLNVRADWLLFGETRVYIQGRPSHLRALTGQGTQPGGPLPILVPTR